MAKIVLAFAVGVFFGELAPELVKINKEFLLFVSGYLLLSVLFIRKYYFLKSVYLLLLVFLGGIQHYHYSNPAYTTDHFSHHTSSEYLVIQIEEINHKSPTKIKIEGEVTHVGHQDSLLQTTGTIIGTLVDIAEPLNHGDKIVCKAKHYPVSENMNPHVFDYRKYLTHRGIFHQIYLDTSEFLLIKSNNPSLSSKSKIFREHCLSIFKKHLQSDKQIGVAAAMVLGERKLLDEELYDAFTDTGAVHILAVSGLHVGIVSGLIYFLLSFWRTNNRLSSALKTTIILTSVWSFALLTGMAAAVTRAALMFTLYYIGKGLLRQIHSYNILATAAMIMLVYDPHYLFQAGFLFSFLALLGIITLYPIIYKMIYLPTGILKKAWGLIAVSFAAQALVSPLAIYYFHKLPIYFWLSGLLAVLGATMVLYFGLGLIFFDCILGSESLITQGVATILSYTIYWLNTWIYWVQKLPYCSADDLWLSNASLVLIYCGLLSAVLYLKKKHPQLLIVSAILFCCQSIVHIIENNTQRKSEKLIVYDSYKGSVIDIYKDGHACLINQDSLDDKSVGYLTQNNRLYHRVTNEVTITEMGLTLDENLFAIKDKLLLLYPDKDAQLLCSASEIDLVVLSADSYQNIRKLAANNTIKQVVLDGTFKKEKYRIKKVCDKLGIPIHLTSNDGAYQLDLI